MAHYSRADLEIIQEEIDRIVQQHGGAVTPEMILEEAKKPDSKLHKFYEWNVDKAANAHWIETSRRLLRVYRVVITTPEGPKETRGLLSVKHVDGERRYTELSQILKSTTMSAEILNRARQDLRTFYYKFRNLKDLVELAGTFKSIEREVLGLDDDDDEDPSSFDEPSAHV